MHSTTTFKLKVLFVRDPYSRLYSGYIDKLLYPNPHYWNVYGTKIISKYRKNATIESMECGYDVTFAEFVEYVVDTYEYKPRLLEDHFSPIHQHCRPCEIDYKIIGKMETFNDDVNYVFNKLEDDDLKRLSAGHNFNEELLHIANDLHYYENINKTCFEEVNVFERVLRTLYLRGFISKDRVSNFNISTLKPSNCNEFICSNCVISTHKDHSFSGISEAVAEEREQAKRHLTDLRSKIETTPSIQDKVRSYIDQLHVDSKKCVETIQSVSKDLQTYIETRKNIKMTEVEDNEWFALQTHESFIKDAKMSYRRYKQITSELENLLSEKHDPTFHSCFGVIKIDMQNLADVPAEPSLTPVQSFENKILYKDIIEYMESKVDGSLCQSCTDLHERLDKIMKKHESCQQHLRCNTTHMREQDDEIRNLTGEIRFLKSKRASGYDQEYWSESDDTDSDGPDDRCYRCRKHGHYARVYDEPRGVECYNCHEIGHYARDCPEKDKCLISIHKDHSHVEIDGEVSDEREKSKLQITDLRAKIAAIPKIQEKAICYIDQLHVDTEHCIVTINSVCEDLQTFIKARKNIKVTEVEDYEILEHQSYESFMKNNELIHKQYTQIISELENLLF
ncbi:CHST11 [Mytilus edulis]|uniref:Carbohydrate sulfotransferase n=1 Tax=Mytilus edulis TaxID=6550 RepID=A0A8S3UVI5_MYTED|nr:CHST11 [Mytilus edulis]